MSIHGDGGGRDGQTDGTFLLSMSSLRSQCGYHIGHRDLCGSQLSHHTHTKSLCKASLFPRLSLEDDKAVVPRLCTPTKCHYHFLVALVNSYL